MQPGIIPILCPLRLAIVAALTLIQTIWHRATTLVIARQWCALVTLLDPAAQTRRHGYTLSGREDSTELVD